MSHLVSYLQISIRPGKSDTCSGKVLIGPGKRFRPIKGLVALFWRIWGQIVDTRGALSPRRPRARAHAARAARLVDRAPGLLYHTQAESGDTLAAEGDGTVTKRRPRRQQQQWAARRACGCGAKLTTTGARQLPILLCSHASMHDSNRARLRAIPYALQY